MGKNKKQQWAAEAKSKLTEAKKIYRKLRKGGYSHIEAAGVLGNIMQESRFIPTATNGSHWGYTQNDKYIKGQIEKIYGNYSPESQIDYLVKGYRGANYANGMKDRFTRFRNRKSNSYTNAALNWVNDYEVAPGQNDKARIYFANYFGNAFNPNGSDIMDISGNNNDVITSNAQTVNMNDIQSILNKNASDYKQQLETMNANYDAKMKTLTDEVLAAKQLYEQEQIKNQLIREQEAIENAPINQYLKNKVMNNLQRNTANMNIEVPMFYTPQILTGERNDKLAYGGKRNSSSLYELNINGKRMLMMYPSTGSLNGDRNMFRIGGGVSYSKKASTEPLSLMETDENGNVVIRGYNGETLSTIPPYTANTSSTPIATPADTKQNNFKTKLKTWFSNPTNTNDAISLGANTLGNIGSFIINNRMLKDLQYNAAPIPRIAAKLKTNYNINPQVDAVREGVAANNRYVNDNTASSNVAMARNQANNLTGIMDINKLYGTKENEETKLINADKLNQQEVANKSIEDYNTYLKERQNFLNTIREKKSENAVALLNGINQSVQNIVANRNQRLSDYNTMAAMMMASNHLPVEAFPNGVIPKTLVDWYRTINPLIK